MSSGHFFDVGGYLDYGDATALLPVKELLAIAYTHRDVECALEETPADCVLAIRSTALANSYRLVQRPLTAIEGASLDNELRNQISGIVNVDLDQSAVIQVGRATTPA